MIGNGIAFTISSLLIYNSNKIDFNATNLTIDLMGCYIGSFIPDIDCKESYFNYKFRFFSDLYKPVQKLAFKNAITYNIFKHRGALWHSWITVLIVGYLYYRFDNLFLFGMGIAIFIHHILDMFTDQGLRYFYPLRKRIKF